MSIESIAENRETQLKRVLYALRFFSPAKAIGIILMWMSMDDVEVMLENLEKQDGARE